MDGDSTPGGQSWLVGHCGPMVSNCPGVHALPLLAPPWHRPPAQMGQDWTPAEQNPPPVQSEFMVQQVPALVPPSQ